MSKTLAVHPWAAPNSTGIPKLDGFTICYGVQVSSIGEEDELIALGHVGELRALAAFRKYVRDVVGEDLFYGDRPLLTQAVKRVEHTWHANDADPEEWFLRRARETDDGAFPTTWWAGH